MVSGITSCSVALSNWDGPIWLGVVPRNCATLSRPTLSEQVCEVFFSLRQKQKRLSHHSNRASYPRCRSDMLSPSKYFNGTHFSSIEWCQRSCIAEVEQIVLKNFFAALRTLPLVGSIVAISQPFYLRSYQQNVITQPPWPRCRHNKKYCVCLMNACVAIAKFQDTQALLMIKSMQKRYCWTVERICQYSVCRHVLQLLLMNTVQSSLSYTLHGEICGTHAAWKAAHSFCAM